MFMWFWTIFSLGAPGLYAFVSQIKVMWSVIKEIFPFPFVFSFLIMRTYAAKCNAEIWKKRFSWVTKHELHLDWIKHKNWSLLKIIRSNKIKWSLSRRQFLSEAYRTKPGQVVYNPLPRLYISFLPQPFLYSRRNASVYSLKVNCTVRLT